MTADAETAPASEFPTDRLPAIRRVMQPADTNAMGTIFGGAILSEIDLAAAIAAHAHHSGTLVTIAMDRVEFHRPIFVGDVMTIFTEVLRIGTTSITVKCCVWAERRMTSGEVIPVTEAQVTMVAVGDDFRPVPIQKR